MVWLLQPKDFVYGQSYARLSYRIFYTENSEKTIVLNMHEVKIRIVIYF